MVTRTIMDQSRFWKKLTAMQEMQLYAQSKIVSDFFEKWLKANPQSKEIPKCQEALAKVLIEIGVIINIYQKADAMADQYNDKILQLKAENQTMRNEIEAIKKVFELPFKDEKQKNDNR